MPSGRFQKFELTGPTSGHGREEPLADGTDSTDSSTRCGHCERTTKMDAARYSSRREGSFR